MSENYQWVTEALDHLDPALLEALDGGADKTKARRRAPRRVLLVAACICALLVTTAVAAEVAGFNFVKIFKGEEKDGYDIWADATELAEYIPSRELSPALQELEEQYKDTDYHIEHLFFDSWEEAETYIGHEISDNAILAQGKLCTIIPTDEGEKQNVCSALIYIKYGKISTIMAYASYKLGWENPRSSSDISIDATLYIGDEPTMWGAGTMYVFNDYMTAEGQENYLTANGLEAVIVNMRDNPAIYSGEGGEYNAHFFLRGVYFCVDTNYSGPEDQEIVLARLKEVLDNFQ